MEVVRRVKVNNEEEYTRLKDALHVLDYLWLSGREIHSPEVNPPIPCCVEIYDTIKISWTLAEYDNIEPFAFTEFCTYKDEKENALLENLKVGDTVRFLNGETAVVAEIEHCDDGDGVNQDLRFVTCVSGFDNWNYYTDGTLPGLDHDTPQRIVEIISKEEAPRHTKTEAWDQEAPHASHPNDSEAGLKNAPHEEHTSDSEAMTQSAPHASHYKGRVEPIDLIESMGFGEEFCIGNCIKYLARYNKKGTPVSDLRKAQWYLDRVLENIRKKTEEEGK